MELPAEPVYGNVEKYGRRGNEWILPDFAKPFILQNLEELILTKDSDAKEFTDIKEGKAKLWVYGAIRYEDGIAPMDTRLAFAITGLESLGSSLRVRMPIDETPDNPPRGKALKLPSAAPTIRHSTKPKRQIRTLPFCALEKAFFPEGVGGGRFLELTSTKR
jgi:hypothetical protein